MLRRHRAREILRLTYLPRSILRRSRSSLRVQCSDLPRKFHRVTGHSITFCPGILWVDLLVLDLLDLCEHSDSGQKALCPISHHKTRAYND